MNYWLPLITGLTVGGFSCAAVQGGLLASVISVTGDKRQVTKYWITGAFLISKLVVYTMLGVLLGAFGQTLALSSRVQVSMQLVAGLYMLAVAGNLLKLHPIFRYAIIQPPRFLTRLVRKESKSADFFAPVFLGAMTVFIPCGTTLAMEAVAISTGNPFYGALTMALFIIGTSPTFLGIGVLAAAGQSFQKYFSRVAAAVLIYLGLSSVNGSLILSGSPITFNKIGNVFAGLGRVIANPAGDYVAGAQTQGVQVINGVQNASIDVLANGYAPDFLEVKAGIPVKLNLTPKGGLGCTSVFVIPQLKISKQLSLGTTTSVEFTPDKPGTLTWACGMGMYTGTLKVI